MILSFYFPKSRVAVWKAGNSLIAAVKSAAVEDRAELPASGGEHAR